MFGMRKSRLGTLAIGAWSLYKAVKVARHSRGRVRGGLNTAALVKQTLSRRG